MSREGDPNGTSERVAGALHTREATAHVLEDADTRLVEVVDSLLERGVMLTGDVVLGLADVDLIYLKLSTLLAAADRVFRRRDGEGTGPAPGGPVAPGGPGAPDEAADAGGAEPAPSPSPAVASPAPATASAPSPAGPAPRAGVAPADAEALRTELEARSRDPATEVARWNPEPDDVERSVARLVLTLVDFVRQLLERQAIRRMEEETLTPEEVERLGRALMRLEETLVEIAARFGLDPGDLNLDLGPLGKLT